jgi:hypothetical protein
MSGEARVLDGRARRVAVSARSGPLWILMAAASTDAEAEVIVVGAGIAGLTANLAAPRQEGQVRYHEVRGSCCGPSLVHPVPGRVRRVAHGVLNVRFQADDPAARAGRVAGERFRRLVRVAGGSPGGWRVRR